MELTKIIELFGGGLNKCRKNAKHTDDSLIQCSELPGNTYQHSISHSERIDILPQESFNKSVSTK